MAVSLQSLLLALASIGTTVRLIRTCQPNPGSLSAAARALERHALRRRMQKRRRILLGGSRKPRSRVERRIRTLRKLVSPGESVGLDGLFMETADYIACLRMQVEVMQVLVKALSGDSDE